MLVSGLRAGLKREPSVNLDCPAAVSENERRQMHWPHRAGKRRLVGVDSGRRARKSEDLPHLPTFLSAGRPGRLVGGRIRASARPRVDRGIQHPRCVHSPVGCGGSGSAVLAPAPANRPNRGSMEARAVVRAWGLILSGYRPNLSVEITRECPLRCPGLLRLRRHAPRRRRRAAATGGLQGPGAHRRHARSSSRVTPLHLSIVGGEPLVRYRELEVLLPQLTAMGIHTQVVTSAVRPIPEGVGGDAEAAGGRLDRRPAARARSRRAPATYDRILKHIKGQHITVHCTMTRQQARAGLRRRSSRSSGPPIPTSSGSGSASTRRRRAKTSPEMLAPGGSRSAGDARSRAALRASRSCTT